MTETCPICRGSIEPITVDGANNAVHFHKEPNFDKYVHFTCIWSAIEWLGKAMQSFQFSEKGLAITSTGDMKIASGEVRATVDADQSQPNHSTETRTC